jgi:hypothetical protein
MVDARAPTQHVKATLPPSIYFPGEAEIRYYLKVTVNRPSLLKENPRQVSLTLISLLLVSYEKTTLMIRYSTPTLASYPLNSPAQKQTAKPMLDGSINSYMTLHPNYHLDKEADLLKS